MPPCSVFAPVGICNFPQVAEPLGRVCSVLAGPRAFVQGAASAYSHYIPMQSLGSCLSCDPFLTLPLLVHWKEPSSGTPPRLGTLRVTDPTPDSLHLIWTVPEGQFDSFMVQYKDREGQPQVVPVEGPDRSVTVSPLDPDHKYRFSLFGVANKKQYGPLTAEGTTGEWLLLQSLCEPSNPYTLVLSREPPRASQQDA